MADKRAVLIVVDGMGDRPLIDHDYKTPLEYANTPNMDRLAKGGLVGLLDPISPGVRPGSDVANLALFGYDPAKYYTGRGPLEARGKDSQGCLEARKICQRDQGRKRSRNQDDLQTNRRPQSSTSSQRRETVEECDRY